MRIAAVQAYVLSTEKLADAEEYEATAGLRFPDDSPSGEGFGRTDERHLCVYPTARSTVLITAEAENGLVGIGEAHAPVAPRVVRTIIQDLFALLLIGQDARQIGRLWERMFAAMHLRSHTQGFTMEAIAGIDIALWDLLGKHRQEPIHMLLGGAYRMQIPLYASGIPGESLTERLEAVDSILKSGFRVLKTSCGRGSLQDQIEMMSALSDAVGDKGQLTVDAHGAFDLSDALQFARFLEGLPNTLWLEDPLIPENHDGYRELTQSTTLRIAMGETECNRYGVRDRLLGRECNLLLPDVCRAGGISETLRIAQLADVFGVSWASHVSTSTAIHLMAGIHVGAVTPNFLISEFPTAFDQGPFGNVLLSDPIAVDAGQIQVNDKPGLGVELNQSEIDRLIVD
jgi:L-alanine-DL-glutamate epimerase-like enolase superfamily enzyme